MHLCDSSMEVGMHAQHVYEEIRNDGEEPCKFGIFYLAMDIILSESEAAPAYAAIATVINRF